MSTLACILTMENVFSINSGANNTNVRRRDSLSAWSMEMDFINATTKPLLWTEVTGQ